MEQSMSSIALMAILSLPCGAFLGMIYDVIRFSRILVGVTVENPFKKHRRFALLRYLYVVLGDLLFFAIASVVMCVFFFLTGDGRMRSYGIFGALLGFFVYYHTLGRLFIAISSRLVAFCRHILMLPVKLLKKIFNKFWRLPIVTAAFTRYNEYINNRKKIVARKKRQKRMKKGQNCKNGGGT